MPLEGRRESWARDRRKSAHSTFRFETTGNYADNWRNIPITLIDPARGFECNRLLSAVGIARAASIERSNIGSKMRQNTRPSPFWLTGNVFWGLLAACCVMILIGAVVPLSQPRIPMNHMRAANSSIQLIAAERQYPTSFPALGFTCDLRQLAQSGLVDKVLASGDKAGYHYELHGCGTTAPASLFSFTAAPIFQDKTGKFAFCANQEGVLWYARDGSTDECFRARATWTRSHVWR